MRTASAMKANDRNADGDKQQASINHMVAG